MKVERGSNKFSGFDLVPETAGKISNGVYIKKDKSEIIICFAWGDNLHYKPIKNIKDDNNKLQGKIKKSNANN